MFIYEFIGFMFLVVCVWCNGEDYCGVVDCIELGCECQCWDLQYLYVYFFELGKYVWVVGY